MFPGIGLIPKECVQAPETRFLLQRISRNTRQKSIPFRRRMKWQDCLTITKDKKLEDYHEGTRFFFQPSEKTSTPLKAEESVKKKNPLAVLPLQKS
jgi:hypothetical protein